MCGRDVCKPVAARAVSVSLGRQSVRPPSADDRFALSVAPARPPSRSLRRPSIARARASRLSLGGRGRPSPPLGAHSTLALNRRRRYAPSLRFVRCVRDSFGPIGSFVSSCPLPRRVPFPSSLLFTRFFFFFVVFLNRCFSVSVVRCHRFGNRLCVAVVLVPTVFARYSRAYLRPCNSYLPTSSHVP